MRRLELYQAHSIILKTLVLYSTDCNNLKNGTITSNSAALAGKTQRRKNGDGALHLDIEYRPSCMLRDPCYLL